MAELKSAATEDVSLSRSRALISRFELLLAIAVLACLGANTVAAFRQVSRPYEVDYEEGNVLNACLRLVQGQTPYPPADQVPSALNPYGPVAYGVLALPVSAESPSFAPGRVMVFGFCLLSAVLIALILRLEGAGWRVALLFGGLYLTFPAVQDWMFLLRVDYLGVVFSLLGLFVFARSDRSGLRDPDAGAKWLWCVPLFALAFFTKVTFLAAPASCVVYLLWRRDARKALLLSASLLGMFALIFLLVQRWSGGWFFFHNLHTHPDPYTVSHLLYVGRGLVSQIVPLTLAGVFAVRRLRGGVPSLAAIYFAIALLGSLTAGKAGSSTNHFLELLASSAICAGLFYGDFLGWLGASDGSAPRRVRWVGLAVLTMAVSALVLVPVRAIPQLEFGRGEYAQCPELYEYVRGHPGKNVLSENVGAVVLAGKPVMVSNPFVYGQLAMHGRGSDEQLRRMVESRYFDVVVLADSVESFRESPSVVWSTPMLAAIEKHYRPVRQFTCAYGRVAYEMKRY